MKAVNNITSFDVKWFFLNLLIWLGAIILIELLAVLFGGWLNLGLALLASFLIFLLYVAVASVYQHYRKK